METVTLVPPTAEDLPAVVRTCSLGTLVAACTGAEAAARIAAEPRPIRDSRTPRADRESTTSTPPPSLLARPGPAIPPNPCQPPPEHGQQSKSTSTADCVSIAVERTRSV